MSKRTSQRSGIPMAPQHLQPSTRAWGRAVVGQLELGEHHLRLLTLCAEAWDRGQEARSILATAGWTIENRRGEPRRRPEGAIERGSRLGFARLLRELALDVAPPPDVRPPRRPGTDGTNERGG